MMSNNPFPLSVEQLREAYRSMRTIREFEERIHIEFARGDLPGFVHLYSGQEACATGIMMHLNDHDRIASTHRGHGHCIAKGVDVHSMMAEIYGKESGACHGKGGSMHIADLDKGMMGANGIVGAGAPLVCGAGLAAKFRGDGGVGVIFLGDGAANEGAVLESMNLAAVWDLPVIFAVENNGYAEATTFDYATKVDSFADRATGFGMPGVSVDGTDFFAVYEAAGEIIARARAGGGPALLECNTVRFFGHFEGDAQTYKAPNENEKNRTDHDCLKRFVARVTGAGVMPASALEAIDGEITKLIEDAVIAAKAASFPTEAALTRDVYLSY